MAGINDSASDSSLKANVLVVDDEPSVLNLLQVILNGAGYNVVTCDSGSEALRLINLTAFACVITDASMPVMSGYDLVKALRRHPVHADLPILMLTRKRHRLDVKRAVDAGVTDYVLKPIDEHLLLDKVALCVKKGESKRQVYELSLVGAEANATIDMECRILSLSESDITLKLPFELPPAVNFILRSRVFEDMGMETPLLRLVKCDRVVDSVDGKAHFRTRVAFVGLQEADLMKIRSWTQRESVRQRR